VVKQKPGRADLGGLRFLGPPRTLASRRGEVAGDPLGTRVTAVSDFNHDPLLNPEHIVRELLHRTCIGAVAQPETGGDLLLHFGDWQHYETPPNPALLATERGKWSFDVIKPLETGWPQWCCFAIGDRSLIRRNKEESCIALKPA
jgi:hypothetical protein